LQGSVWVVTGIENSHNKRWAIDGLHRRTNVELFRAEVLSNPAEKRRWRLHEIVLTANPKSFEDIFVRCPKILIHLTGYRLKGRIAMIATYNGNHANNGISIFVL
jgi:hypothetical protein